MRVLLVTPVESGSGETITCIHLAETVVRGGGEVLFLASAFAAGFIREQFTSALRVLGRDMTENRRSWDTALAEFAPDAIVFGDYPLLFMSSGTVPLVDDGWVRSLAKVDARLVTLDHTGFAQGAIGLFFGPAHLSLHYEAMPAVPDEMEILLPCPMHEPGPVEGRRGTPFRYWPVPLEIPPEVREATRARYLRDADEYLVFHAAAPWAWQPAIAFGLPHYRYLPTLLARHFAGAPKTVRLVSLNSGDLLPDPQVESLTVENVASMPKSQFEALLFSSDLMLTENRISITLGKAVCGLLPCAALVNSHTYRALLARADPQLRSLLFQMEDERPGAIYPYAVFPGGMIDELERLGLYRDNSLAEAFRTLEIYADGETGRALTGLLADDDVRAELRGAQLAYVERLARLEDGEQVLRRLVAGRGAG